MPTYPNARLAAFRLSMGLALGLLLFLGHPGYALALLGVLGVSLAFFIAISREAA